MGQRIEIIANPIAGGRKDRRRIAESVRDYFARDGNECCLNFTARKAHARELAERAVSESASIVIVVGGDGTINEVGSALINTDVSLGIVPCGSGNGLARTLAIPENVARACKLIQTGDTCRIDVGRANARYFLLVAGIGFDAQVGRRFDESPHRGPLPYFYLSAKEYFSFEPSSVTIEFDGQTRAVNPFMIAVANGQQYGNNAWIAPKARLNDGLLDLCIVHRLGAMNLFEAIPKLFQKRIDEYSQMETYQTDGIVIQREKAEYVNLDGEPVLEEPELAISIIPKCLKVVLPKNSPGISS